MPSPPVLQTRRLILRPWCDADVDAYAALNADPQVMEHFPSVLSREASDASAAQIRKQLDERGFGLWAAEVPGVAAFIGFIGLSEPTFATSFTPCVEIGWRLARPYWGCGYATEGARAALAYAFATLELPEIVSMTTTTNQRSMRVMERIGMHRNPSEDFEHPRVAEGHPLRRHVLYRLSRTRWLEDAEVPPLASQTVARARYFAGKLDADHFECARPMVAPDCVYDVRGETHVGRDAILASYAAATRFAHSLPCDVRYESAVHEEPGGVRIMFTDVLSHAGREHRHVSLQHLTFDANGAIARIVHEDIPGERETLRTFLDQLGGVSCG
jgi:RimJ/RimL family protein N-acetyltransferase